MNGQDNLDQKTEQGFSHLNVLQNQLKGWSKPRILGLTPNQFLTQKFWNWAWECAFLISFQVMLMLLLREAHFQELQGREIVWEKRSDRDGTFSTPERRLQKKVTPLFRVHFPLMHFITLSLEPWSSSLNSRYFLSSQNSQHQNKAWNLTGTHPIEWLK